MNTLKLIEIVDKADKDFALALVPAETLKKFAELIVRECALQCVHNEDMDRIEKHFGVEE